MRGAASTNHEDKAIENPKPSPQAWERDSRNYFAASATNLSKIALFLLIWLFFGITFREPSSRLLPNFKN